MDETPPDAPSGLSVGQTLKQFRILAKLGEGGMGVVYRAVDESLRREVAVKVLPDSLASDPDRRRRFLREARAAAAVTHHNIATVHEVGEADGHVFIAMELIQGETLRAYIDRGGGGDGGLSHAESLRIARDVARGLARAHAKGVVHRDLKPENIMVTPEGDVKILDFGLAKVHEAERANESASSNAATVSQLTAAGRILGTPAYMSPEQADGRMEIDARSDVFSFGAMLYEMLAGVRPFVGSSSIAILYAVMHQEPQPLELAAPDVPPRVAGVVAKCLKKEREDRFASAREVVVALRGDSVPPTLETPSGSAPRPARDVHVTGTGTALGATLVAEAPPSEAIRSTRRSRARGAIPWVLAGAALTLIGAAGAAATMAWSRRAQPRVVASTPASSGSSASSGPRHGVAMTDHPLPRSESRDAVFHYASALSRVRIGAMQSGAEFQRAVSEDLTLAAAHLRLALLGVIYRLPANERRSHFAKATELTSALDARDRGLLPLAELAVADPVDPVALLAKARALSEQHPTDAELAMLVYIYIGPTGAADEADSAARHVLELDPGATYVLKLQADRANQEGDKERARSLLDRCIADAPQATLCLDLRATLNAMDGKCDAELDDARTLVKLEPDMSTPYFHLGAALADTGAESESVENAYHQGDSRVTPTARSPKGASDLKLAIRSGDLAAADAAAVAITPAVAQSNSEEIIGLLALARLALAEESGSRANALEVAERFDRGASAWTGEMPTGARTKRLFLMHEAGKLDDAAFEAAKDRLWEEELRLRPPKDAAAAGRRRAIVEAAYAETGAEAKQALSRSAPPWGSKRGHPGEALALGHALLLAGQAADAVPLLERVTRECHLASDEWTAPLEYVQAHLFLGQALEATGDTASACRAYGVIHARWRDAKPRSVTLEKASERAHALGCAAMKVDGGK